MSLTLSTNSGSLESLNVCERWGCKPKAVHILRMVVCEKPAALAIERIDQCVASLGVERSVRSITAATWSSSIVRGLPGRASSKSPSMRSFRNRRRHLPTVCSWTPSSLATDLLGTPSAHRRITRQRSDNDRATRRRRTCRSFREVLSQQAVRILVRTTLPRALRIPEVYLKPGIDAQPDVLCHFRSSVPCQRLKEMLRAEKDARRQVEFDRAMGERESLAVIR